MSGIRAPKEQYLPVNLSGTKDRTGSDASGKRWDNPPADGERLWLPPSADHYRISQALGNRACDRGGGTHRSSVCVLILRSVWELS
ncbi:hypothetical protein RE2895_30840 [Rhodococcus erythropolis]|nr:hypothetical protein RHOER0001_6518 [Rhodococcus erythropolis SK121]BBE46153.1 hypothetical protein RE2895_30840 [Rhodococcus erythropolis]